MRSTDRQLRSIDCFFSRKAHVDDRFSATATTTTKARRRRRRKGSRRRRRILGRRLGERRRRLGPRLVGVVAGRRRPGRSLSRIPGRRQRRLRRRLPPRRRPVAAGCPGRGPVAAAAAAAAAAADADAASPTRHRRRSGRRPGRPFSCARPLARDGLWHGRRQRPNQFLLVRHVEDFFSRTMQVWLRQATTTQPQKKFRRKPTTSLSRAEHEPP